MKIELEEFQSALVVSDNGDVKAYVNTSPDGKDKESTVSTAVVAALSYLLKTKPSFMEYITDQFDNAVQEAFKNQRENMGKKK